MESGIYCITNLKNGKVYIGQSRNIHKRWSAHKSAYRRKYNTRSLLCRAMLKHGIESFKFEVLEYCPEEKLDELERYYISRYKSMYNQNGYNIESGGGTGEKISELVSQNKRGKKNPMYGKRLSKEHRQLISLNNRGSNNKLTKKQVAQIKKDVLASVSQAELASRHNVGIDTINKIARCKNWAWVLPEINEQLLTFRDDQEQQIDNRVKELWDNGCGVVAIVRELGCDGRRVSRVVGTTKHKELEKRNRLIIQDFENGLTRDELEAKHQVSRAVVNAVVHEATQRQKKQLYDEWLSLRKQGVKVKDIAKMYDVNRTTVTDNTREFFTATS